MMWVHRYPHLSSISSTWKPYLCFFPAILISSTSTDKNNLCFRWSKKTFPSRYFFPIQVPIEFLRTVFPTAIWLMDDRTSFVQEVPHDLHCLTMISAICVVEDVSKHLHIPTEEFWAIWEHPPIVLECKKTLHQLLVRHNPVILQSHPSLLRQSFEMLTSPAQKKLQSLQSRLLQSSPRSTTLPLYFCNSGYNSTFLRWHMSIDVAKWTFLVCLCVLPE